MYIRLFEIQFMRFTEFYIVEIPLNDKNSHVGVIKLSPKKLKTTSPEIFKSYTYSCDLYNCYIILIHPRMFVFFLRILRSRLKFFRVRQ